MARPDLYDTRANAPQPGVQGPAAQAPPGRVGIQPAAPAVTPARSATGVPNAPAGDGASPNPVQHPAATPAATGFYDRMNTPKKVAGPAWAENAVESGRNAIAGIGRNVATAFEPGHANKDSAVYKAFHGAPQVPTTTTPAAAAAATPAVPGADELNSYYNAQGYGPGAAAVPQKAAAVTPGIGVQQAPAAAPVASQAQPRAAAQPRFGVQYQPRMDHSAQDAITRQIEYHNKQAEQSAFNARYGNFNLTGGSPELEMQNAAYHTNAASTLTGHLGGIADTQARFDTENAPERAALLQAQAGAADRSSPDQIQQIQRLAGLSPAERAIGLASSGVDGQTIASLPQPAVPGQARYNAMNIGPEDRVDQDVQGLHAAMNDPSTPLHMKLAAAAADPLSSVPGSPQHQYVAAWLARQRASDGKWADTLRSYSDVGHDPYSWAVSLGYNKAGFHSQIQDRNRQFHQSLGTLGYPSTAGQE